MSPDGLLPAAFGSPLVHALGWTLVHFLWQGLALGAVYGVLRHTARRASAGLRYWLGMAVLGAMLAAAVVTFVLVYQPAVDPGTAVVQATTVPVAGVGPAVDIGWTGPWLRGVLEPLVPWAVLAWLVGVIAQAARLAADFRALRHMTRGARPLASPWPETVDRIRRQLGIRRVVRVLESVRVGVPIVVGWLRPVIIIPPSALLGLTPRQLELIISHELAHVARLDYLFNLAQILVETLLFFHPAVRYVSRCVRQERENCCDDAVVARTGETLAYARALAEIEGLRCSAGLRPATAATGGHLRGRIARLVALPAPQRGAVGWLAGLALLGFGTAAVLGGARFAADRPDSAAPPPETSRVAAPPGTTTGPSDPVRWAPPVVPASERPDPPSAATAALDPDDAPDVGRRDLGAVAGSAAPDTAADAAPRVVARPAAAETAADPALRVAAGPAVTPAESPAAPPPAVPDASRVDVAEPTEAPPPVSTPTGQRIAAAPAPRPAPNPPAAASTVDGAFDEPPAPPVSVVPASPPAAADPEPTPVVSVPAPVASVSAPVASMPAPAVSGGLDAPPTAPVAPAPTPTIEEPPAADPAPAVTGGALIRSPAPSYPRRARIRGVEGQVTVRYAVDPRGRVRDVEVLSAEPGETFVAAVRRVVKRWRHEPFLRAGEPVATTLTRTFEFAIRAETVADNAVEADACRRVTGSRLCRSRDGYQELGVVVVHNPL